MAVGISGRIGPVYASASLPRNRRNRPGSSAYGIGLALGAPIAIILGIISLFGETGMNVAGFIIAALIMLIVTGVVIGVPILCVWAFVQGVREGLADWREVERRP